MPFIQGKKFDDVACSTDEKKRIKNISVSRNTPNYELKSFALRTGQVAIVKKIKINLLNFINGKIDYLTYKTNFDDLFSEIYDKDVYDESLRILHADYQRKKRLFERITNMLLSGQCLFLTLTFTDKVLESTQLHVRRKYVQRFLKSVSSSYVANIDYGSQYEREHYHAVILSDHIDFDLWTYGNLDVEKVRQNSSAEKLGSYITKLVNHAIKETAKRNHLIYSRKERSC